MLIISRVRNSSEKKNQIKCKSVQWIEEKKTNNDDDDETVKRKENC